MKYRCSLDNEMDIEQTIGSTVVICPMHGGWARCVLDMGFMWSAVTTSSESGESGWVEAVFKNDRPPCSHWVPMEAA